MKKLLIIALILIIVGVAAAFLVYKYVYNKPHPDYVKEQADMRVRAKRLYTDYTANAEAANERYTGKILEIEGQITRIENAEDMIVVVYAFKAGDFGDEGIRITMLPEYKEAARTINPFKSVVIKGYCTGYNGTDIILEKGSMVKTTNSATE
jgi:uncharacterized protein (DUF1330 family)